MRREGENMEQGFPRVVVIVPAVHTGRKEIPSWGNFNVSDDRMTKREFCTKKISLHRYVGETITANKNSFKHVSI